MALVAHGVSYAYAEGTAAEADAICSVDLTVDVGDLVVVAGVTGSGKSTLLRLLAGLLRPAQGSVMVDGTPPHLKAARGTVAIVFQNPEAQFFAETLRADVAFGPRNLGKEDPYAEADRALSAVGLDPAVYGERSPFTLSGGEARRGAIAGAIAMGSRYLLLDEPTAGLDAEGRRSVRSVIEAERARSGIVVVTHDPAEFLASATRLVALADGAVAYSGAVDELLERSHEYEAAGLLLPPVVRVQILARDRGARIDRIAFDPRRAAELLVEAVRGL